MPTYEYACRACSEHLEVVQSFRDDPLTECPSCGGQLRKVFQPVGISFKGSGFYKNDSREAAKSGAKSAGSSDSGSGSSGGSNGGSSSDGTSSSSSTPAPSKSDGSSSSAGASGSSSSDKKSSPAPS